MTMTRDEHDGGRPDFVGAAGELLDESFLEQTSPEGVAVLRNDTDGVRYPP